MRFAIRRQTTPQSEPFWEEFDLTWRPGMNVISGLIDIAMNPVDRVGKATTPITYDSNCLEEVCGSCAMRINGKAAMACSSLVDKLEQPVRLEPLSRFPVVRDLAVDRSVLFENLKRVKAVNLVGIINPSSSSMDGQGRLKADLLRFGAVEARNLDSKLRLESRHVFFTDVKAEVYGGSAVGGLSFDLSAKNAIFNTNARLSGINVAQLLAAFPNGGGKMTGKMEGDVKLAGEIAHSLRPLAGMHGVGHLTVRNGQLPSLKLNANLMKLAHFNDLGPAKDDPSSFKLITTDLELGNQRISSRVIDLDGYGVDVDGSGSVSVSGSDDLNYRGLAEITTKEGFFTNTMARLSGATLRDGKLQFPFRIGGTIDSPVFSKGKGDKDVDAPQNR